MQLSRCDFPATGDDDGVILGEKRGKCLWSVGVSSDERETVKVYVVVTLAGLRRDAHLRLL
jgi:hypothetical protein